MTRLLSTFAILALATPALAQTAMEIDTDGDGGLSLEEMQAAYPDLQEDLYIAMDTDEDGSISLEEHEAAVDIGLLPS